MKLTIIIPDNAVYVDANASTNLDLSDCAIPDDVHALQWSDSQGWIEYKLNEQPNNVITQLPVWANNCVEVWNIANQDKLKPLLPPTAEQNKQWASMLLDATDWTTIPDVADPTKSNPYLSNPEEFVVYRNLVRQYAINPVAGYIDWATKPNTIWLTIDAAIPQGETP